MARPPKKPPGGGAGDRAPNYRKQPGRLIRIRPKQIQGIDLICFRDGVDSTEVANGLIRDALAKMGLFPPELISGEWAELKKRMESGGK